MDNHIDMNHKEIITDLMVRLYCEKVSLYHQIFEKQDVLNNQIMILQELMLAEGLEYGINFMSFDNLIKYDVEEKF